MTIHEFKLAALSLEITDAQVEQVFLNTEITSEEDIKEAVAMLEQYRPNLFTALSSKLRNAKKAVS